jgi:hypothetical protein
MEDAMKIVTIAVLFLTAQLAHAGVQTGTVRFQHGQYASGPSSAGYTFFLIDGGTRSGAPNCATQVGRWVINNDWPAIRHQPRRILAEVDSIHARRAVDPT